MEKLESLTKEELISLTQNSIREYIRKDMDDMLKVITDSIEEIKIILTTNSPNTKNKERLESLQRIIKSYTARVIGNSDFRAYW